MQQGSDDIGPLDIRILELKGEITSVSNANGELQAKWLARNNELIGLQKVWEFFYHILFTTT